MPNASKQKGNRWEREVAEHLTQVFGLNFCRVPNSGAFIGGKNEVRKQFLSENQILLATGDIIVPDELKHISLECKSYKEFSFQSLFTSNKLLNSWIDQAKTSGKKWFLLFKISRAGGYVVFHSKQKWSVAGRNILYYGSYTICSIDGFFEANKDLILNDTQKEVIVGDV